MLKNSWFNLFIIPKHTIFCLILLSYNISYAEVDNKLIQRIQQNLAKLNKVAIDFIQHDNKKIYAQGKLLIQRPNFFRCNYYPPYPLLIVGGEKFISIYDYDMKTITRIRQQNLLSMIFCDGLEKNANFEFTNTSQNDHFFIIEMLYSESGQKISLFFDKKSLNRFEP